MFLHSHLVMCISGKLCKDIQAVTRRVVAETHVSALFLFVGTINCTAVTEVSCTAGKMAQYVKA